jgi:hypothetical protein
MARPSVNVTTLNGQLGIVGPSANGVTALLLTCGVAPTAGFGVAFVCKSKQDVSAAFSNVANAAVVAAINTYFYGEAPEGTELHIVALINTTQLDALAAATNADKALNSAAGKARLLGLVKFPAGGYTPTVANGFDTDVHAAVPIIQAVANTWLAAKKGFRALIQGASCDGNAGSATDYATTNNRSAQIIVGELNSSTQNTLLAVLGRAARVQPQENVGKIKTGSLKVPENTVLTIGSTVIRNITAATLNAYHDKRYVTLELNEIAAGYVVTDDVMLCKPTDDYNNLRHGRIIDNAVRVAFATYYKELKDDVDVDDNGRMSLVAEKALEAAIEGAIDTSMRNQLSLNKSGSANVSVAVNPDYDANIALYNQNGISTAPSFNLLQTGTTYIFLKIQPKGSLQTINVFVGLGTI